MGLGLELVLLSGLESVLVLPFVLVFRLVTVVGVVVVRATDARQLTPKLRWWWVQYCQFIM